MKKKGFTLIELLGVIIVLAIIVLIAVPTILGVIDKAKKGSLKNSAYGLIEAANLYYAQYGVSNTERFNLEEENELKYKGKVESGTVLLNSKGKVMICINDNGNAAYKNYNDNEVVVISGKTCDVNTSETQVLLDGEKTIDEYTNQELTDLVNSLQEQIEIQQQETTSLQQQIKIQQQEITNLKQQINNKADNSSVAALTTRHNDDINTIDNKIGLTSISNVGDGTITGAISTLNSKSYKAMYYFGNIDDLHTANDTGGYWLMPNKVTGTFPLEYENSNISSHYYFLYFFATSSDGGIQVIKLYTALETNIYIREYVNSTWGIWTKI